MAELSLKNVGKTYGGTVTVLQDINLEIARGELIVFVGPSGCGKSTLLRMIAGLERITAGDLTIEGVRVNDMPPAQRGIAMVFQSYALYPHMTVRENMAFALKLAKKTKAEIDEAVNRAAEGAATRGLSRPAAQGALRRATAARGDRPVDRARPQGLPLRRAALEPRRQLARGHPDRDRAIEGIDARQHDDLRHPRPGGGDDARLPHRGSGQQGHRAGRLAAGAL